MGDTIKARFSKILTLLRTNKKITLAVGVILLGLIAGTYLIISSQHKNQNLNGKVCKNETLDAAAKVLARSQQNIPKLKAIAEKIENTKSFDKDVNCLNIVLTHHIYSGNVDKAKSYLAKLESIYPQSNRFSVRLGPDAKSIQQLRADVKFLEQLQAEAEKNAVRTGTPKQEQNKTYQITPPASLKKPDNYKQ